MVLLAWAGVPFKCCSIFWGRWLVEERDTDSCWARGRLARLHKWAGCDNALEFVGCSQDDVDMETKALFDLVLDALVHSDFGQIWIEDDIAALNIRAYVVQVDV